MGGGNWVCDACNTFNEPARVSCRRCRRVAGSTTGEFRAADRDESSSGLAGKTGSSSDSRTDLPRGEGLEDRDVRRVAGSAARSSRTGRTSRVRMSGGSPAEGSARSGGGDRETKAGVPSKASVSGLERVRRAKAETGHPERSDRTPPGWAEGSTRADRSGTLGTTRIDPTYRSARAPARTIPPATGSALTSGPRRKPKVLRFVIISLLFVVTSSVAVFLGPQVVRAIGSWATDSTAKCPSQVRSWLPAGEQQDAVLVASYQTDKVVVTFCRGVRGQLYYDGQKRNATASAETHILLLAYQTSAGFIATNGSFTYEVRGDRLIVTERGEVLADDQLEIIAGGR